ncbi:MAG: hypothetical protein LBT57_00775 [Puniceicoccales bacterium]|jgi:hypothetical protein|nr:hypothetical protein [Puniceicoccales bacterium]
MMGNRILGIVLGVAALGSAVPGDVFGGREDDFTFACSLVIPLGRIPEALGKYVPLLPEEAPSGNPLGGQSFWQGVSKAFVSLAEAELEGQTAAALYASLKEDQGSGISVENFTGYEKELFKSLGEGEGILLTLAGTLSGQIRPLVYNPNRKGLTAFGSNLYRAYTQSLTSFTSFHRISDEQRSFLLDLLRGFFSIGSKGVVPGGSAAAGWVPEPTEALSSILLDLCLIYELNYGSVARTYNPSFLSSQKEFAKHLLVLHLTRFVEALTRALQAQEEPKNPFYSADVPDETTASTALQESKTTGTTTKKTEGALTKKAASSGSAASSRESVPSFPGDEG